MRARTSVISVASAVVVVAVWPAQALARVVVRFVHAVPGAGEAELQISSARDGGSSVGRARFGQATSYRGVPSGPISWRLVGTASNRVLDAGRGVLRDGSYTVVALARKSGAELIAFPDQAGAPGKARLRLIHAAPELGTPDLRLDGRIVAPGVRFRQATPYLVVPPGTHSVAATPPGRSSRVVFRDGLRLVAGEAATGIVIGTDGQRTRIVTLRDGASPAAAPRRARGPASRSHASRSPARASGNGGGRNAGTVTVRRGESLWSIARQRLGRSASDARVEQEVRRLWSVNSRHIGTRDANLLFPGQTLRVA